MFPATSKADPHQTRSCCRNWNSRWKIARALKFSSKDVQNTRSSWKSVALGLAARLRWRERHWAIGASWQFALKSPVPSLVWYSCCSVFAFVYVSPSETVSYCHSQSTQSWVSSMMHPWLSDLLQLGVQKVPSSFIPEWCSWIEQGEA